jgi:hypothetical protein
MVDFETQIAVVGCTRDWITSDGEFDAKNRPVGVPYENLYFGGEGLPFAT